MKNVSTSRWNAFLERWHRIITSLPRAWRESASLSDQERRTRYFNSRLGFFWELIEPIALAAVFVYLKNGEAIAIEDKTLNFALFVVIGLLTFQSWLDGFLASLSSVDRNKNLLLQIKIVPSAIIFAAIRQSIIKIPFRLVVIISVCIWYNEFHIHGMLIYVVFLSCAIMIGHMMGSMLAPFAIYISDIKMLANVSARPLMFLSGAVFPIPNEGPIGVFASYNPLFYIITSGREALTVGTFPEIAPLFILLFSILLLSLLACYVFHSTAAIAAEKS